MFRATVVACLLLASVLAAGFPFAGAAVSSGDPGAEACVARLGAEWVAPVSVPPSDRDNTASATGSHAGAVRFAAGTSTVSSCLSGKSLVSRATVDISAVDLFDGRVTADSLHLVAIATATESSAGAPAGGSTVSGLRVDGAPRDPSQGAIVVDGLGTLKVLGAATPSSIISASAEVVGLRLDLSVAAGGWPAGTSLIVGRVYAQADCATYRSLSGWVTPSPSPSPSHSKSPTPTPTPTPSAGATLPPTSPGTTSGGSAYTMPAAATPDATLLTRFPGAVMPVAGRYWYADWWHAPRAGGRLHEGTDIFAAYGSPVVAVQDGVIGNVSTAGIGGNNLRLSNDQGDYFYYAHLSRFTPTTVQGARVAAGQTIGYVGTSGDAQGTDPHLHFEIHPQSGVAVNPYPYLEAWRAAGSEVLASTDESGRAVTSGFDPSVEPRGKAGGTPPVDPAALAATLDRVTEGLATLDRSLAAGTGQSPSRQPGGGEAVLTVLSGLGAVVIKRMKLAAILI